MLTQKYARAFQWFRGFTMLLLIGLMLPSGFAFAEAPAAGSFGKYLPANGAENQPVSLALKWDSSESATNYEYCIDTSDNSACDTSWVNTGTINLASVSLAANTIYSWQVRASNGSETTYSDNNSWWSFTTGLEGLTQRKWPASTSAQPPIKANPAEGPRDATVMSVTNLFSDPSFEAYTPNPYWSEYSTNFGTPLCTVGDCGNGGGTAGPRTGSVWSWFGGVPVDEVAYLGQTITTPSCASTLTLQFYLWIGAAGAGSDANDKFIVSEFPSGTILFTVGANQKSSYSTYKLVSIDLSSFADEAAHTIYLASNTTGQIVTFNVDDAVLLADITNCTISGNVGAAGATLSYSGGGSTVSLADGSYSLAVPYNSSGTVTPSLAGVTFTPANRSYSNVITDLTGENYTAAVTLSGNAGVAGATLSYDNGGPQTATADGSGNYSFTVPWGWTGTVVPSLAADVFCPASQAYANLATSKTLQNYAHEACPDFDPISKWTSSFDLSHGWTVSSYVRTTGDVNDDGMADLVGFGQDGVYVALSTGTGFDPVSKWTSAFDLSHGWTVSQYVRTVGDVNNDGMADLVGFGQDGVYVALSTGTGFDPVSKWTSAFDLSHGWTVSSYVRTVGDVNNDGMADIVGFGQDGVYVALSTGTSFGAISKWTSAFDLSHGWTVSSYVRTVGDVNNDDMDDIVGFGQDGVYVALSTGTSFGAMSKWVNAFDLSHGWTVSQFVRSVGDFNGDGKADIVGFGQDGVYISLSMGNMFSLPSRRTTSFDLSHGWTVSSYVRTVGDVDGGGKADLVGFGQDGVYIATAQ